jgi:hypothetical protein
MTRAAAQIVSAVASFVDCGEARKYASGLVRRVD